jgi:hypothetical protein
LSMCVHGLGIGSVITVPEEDRMGEKCDMYFCPYPPWVGYWFSRFLLWELPGCSASPGRIVSGLVWRSVVPLPGLWPQGSTFVPIGSCLGIEDHFVLSFFVGEGTLRLPASYYISQFFGVFSISVVCIQWREGKTR